MNTKKLPILLCLLFTGTSSHLSSATIKEKTFLRTQPPGCGLLMRLDTANIGRYRKPGEPQLKMHITPFYRWSYNKSDIGKYFGMYNDNSGALDDFIEVNSDSETALGNSGDFIHDQTGTAIELKDKVLLRPDRKTYGARIDMCADLDESGDLQLKIGIPLVRVKTSINPESIGITQAGEVPGMGKTATLLDFLSGNIKNLSTDNKQEPLEKLKAPATYQSKMGFSDAEWSISSLIVKKENHLVRFGIIGTLPINKKPEGEFWFEPLLTNGKHVSIGAELSGHARLYRKYSWQTNVFTDLEYRYFFKGSEIRTLLYHNATGEYSAWPVQSLGGQIGEKGVFPLANITTREYDITPGALFEGVLGINIMRKTYSIAIGYSVYARFKEKVEIPSWNDDTYAIALYEYDTTDDFTTLDAFSLAVDGNNAPQAQRTINKENLVADSAATPWQLTHRVFAAIDYQSSSTKYPVFAGIGGFADFAIRENSALKEISFWLRAGITF
ncbi:hypothetical protein KAU11_05630 [Candidatus Babeliales bacterium]|nr:hypothetical protein [Candidatus Babeliales bacterium]